MEVHNELTWPTGARNNPWKALRGVTEGDFNLLMEWRTLIGKKGELRAINEEKSMVPLQLRQHITFYRLHLTYFIVLWITGTLVFWLAPKHISMPVNFIDAWFTVASATCVTGLATIPTGAFKLFDAILMMILIILGSQIFTSLLPLQVRRYLFYQNARQLGIFTDFRSKTGAKNEDLEAAGSAPSWAVVYIEYQALLLLNKIVVGYMIMVHVIGFIAAEICLQASPNSLNVLKESNVNHVLFAMFSTVSLFAGAGYSLLNDNMVPLRTNIPLLLSLALLILLGNTMFPPCLRGILLFLHWCSNGKTKLACEYLLQHPRKCFTHLFPCKQTTWLLITILAFNAIEISSFLVLEWKSKALSGLAPFQKLVVAIFQCANTRHAGANVVTLDQLTPAILVLFIGMMYIAVYPLYLSRENSKEDYEHESRIDEDYYNRILVQSRKLIARDSVYIFFAMFLLCMSQGHRIITDPLNFSIFNIMFEMISAYGNNGLSMGYSCDLRQSKGPCQVVPYSLSGEFNSIGKVIIIVVMMLGRHRGLPENIDAAIILPPKTPSSPSIFQLHCQSLSSTKSFHVVSQQPTNPHKSTK